MSSDECKCIHPKSDIAEFSLQELVMVTVLLVVIGVVAVTGVDLLNDYGDDFCEGDISADGQVCYDCGGLIFNSSSSLCSNSDLNVTTTPNRTDETAEFNASVDAQTAVLKVPTKLGIIVGAIVGAVIIGIIIRYFGGFTGGNGMGNVKVR